MRVGSPESSPSCVAVVPANERTSLKPESREDSIKTLGNFQAKFSTNVGASFVAAGKTGSKLFTNEGWKRNKRRTSADLAVDSLLNEVSVRPADKESRRGSMDSAEKENDVETAQSAASTLPAWQEETNCTIFAVEGSLNPSYPLIRFLSPFAICLDRVRMLFASWSIAYSPVVWAFDDAIRGFIQGSASHCLDLMGDIVFILATLLSFITSVGSSTAGREYVTPKVIRWKRLTSIFVWCDILSCLPLLVGIFVGEVFNPTGFYAGWHLLKLLRIHWVLRMPASHFEMQFNTTVQVLRMLAWIALSTHLIGCLWYHVASGNGVINRHLEDIVDVSGLTHYLVALKQGVYMVTGKPVTPYCDDELLMIGITSPVGGIFFAFIYGNTTMLLTRINILMSKHHKQVALIKSTMRTLDIPHELRERIARYHHFLAVHHNINAYTSLMQGLSVNLFIELKAHLFRKMFSQGAFFRDAPSGFLRRLLQEMIEATFCPGDVVIRCGDLGDQMYFVVKGRLDVLSADGVNIGKITENQYFGEIALLISTPRLVSIRATTYCLLAMINRDTFLPMLEAYPEQKKRMYETMKKYRHQLNDVGEEEECKDGIKFDESKADTSDNETENAVEGMKGLKTNDTAWSEKIVDEKFMSEASQHKATNGGTGESQEHTHSQTLCVPVQTKEPKVSKNTKRRKSNSLTARRLSAVSKASTCSARVDIKEEAHSRSASHSAPEPGETKRKRKKSGFIASLEKVWSTPRNSIVRRPSEVDHFVGALSRIPKPGPPTRSGRQSFHMNIGAPATGTLLHASSNPAIGAGHLLHDSSRWSLVGDLVIDRTEELQHEIEILLDDMETRILEHIDDNLEAPIRELLQESGAMREALNENTRALEAFTRMSSMRSPGMIDT